MYLSCASGSFTHSAPNHRQYETVSPYCSNVLYYNQ